jgi:ABC-type molybdate transport system substrate-binding protein
LLPERSKFDCRKLLFIAATPGVELVGRFPEENQNFLQFAAGIVASGKQQDGAKTLIGFVSSPAAASVMRSKGFE